MRARVFMIYPNDDGIFSLATPGAGILTFGGAGLARRAGLKAGDIVHVIYKSLMEGLAMLGDTSRYNLALRVQHVSGETFSGPTFRSLRLPGARPSTSYVFFCRE